MTDKQSIALKINDWLNDCVAESGAFFLNTVEDGRPKSRPISFHMLKDGGNYFGVGAMKEVYRQMQENPYVELCASDGKGFLRYYGKAVFVDDAVLLEEAFKTAPYLKNMYNETTGRTLRMFYLADAVAEFRDLMTVKESLTM